MRLFVRHLCVRPGIAGGGSLRAASVLVFLTAAVLLIGAGEARADCAALGGVLVGGECQISGAVAASDVAHGGPFVIDRTLRITGTGSIGVPKAAGGNLLTLDIAGDFIMDAPTVGHGARITGDASGAGAVGAAITISAAGSIVLDGTGVTGARITADQGGGSCNGGGRGGDITLRALTGNVVLGRGSEVSSTGSCPGGEIIIEAALAVTIDGQVVSEGKSSRGRGGPISVTSACTLAIGDSGAVVSRGKDPGADLVHLEAGCGVAIQGLVASTGPGHAKGVSNRCALPDRPDKPINAHACVEVWSGGPITIDASGMHRGEINVDTAQSGGVLCCGWIDVFARGDVTILGGASKRYAIHANQALTNAFGGFVTIKSVDGSVLATGRAIQASASRPGGTGGQVVIEGAKTVDLGSALVMAAGDSRMPGGYGVGGKIRVRSYTEDVDWRSLPGALTATGDVRPTGSTVPAWSPGSIQLTACTAIATAGAVFPITKGGSPTGPTTTTGVCPPGQPDQPALPPYVTLPDCLCATPAPDVSVTKHTATPGVAAGQPINYEITVTASGTGDATGVILQDMLPAGLAWTVGGTDAGFCTPGNPIVGGTLLTCSFGTMPSGATRTITLTATTHLGSCPGLQNTATVSADVDVDTGNNTSGPVPITVACPAPTDPNVRVEKTAASPQVAAGQPVVFDIVVTAGGTGDSLDVVLEDVLPPGLTWTVGGPDAGACVPASPVAGGGTLTCSFGTMANGSTRRITLTAPTSAQDCMVVDNTATVTATTDTQGGNNHSSATVTVQCESGGGGGQGCTPGYWKQSHHFDSWPAPYTPDPLFSTVFENAFPGKTLAEVLAQGGGGLIALGRHTVAALLNAASSGVEYDLSVAEVLDGFNTAFPGGDYETQKNEFAGLNEQGCPLN
jgi:uncharacterized repeat protein (TIGR01451 family)